MKINCSKKDLRDFSLMLCIPISLYIFTLIQRNSTFTYSLVTDIDRNIPFLKIFILPYISWYGFVWIVPVYFYFKDRKIYYSTLITYTITVSICCIIYSVFQTEVPRPELIGNDVLTNIINVIYSNDKPVNCFPSIHVLSSFIMIKAVSQSKKKNIFNSLVIVTLGTLIIMSTQFVKQHVILDLIFAILLGNIVFNIVNNFSRESFTEWKKRIFSLLMMKKKSEIW